MFGQAIVAANGVGAAHLQFTHFTLGHRLALFIDNAYFVIGAQRTALGMQQQIRAVIQAGKTQQPLGHAQHLLQGAAQRRRDPFCRAAEQFRTAHLQHAQAGQVGLALVLGVQPQHRQRRHQGGDGDPLLADQRKAGLRVRAARTHHAPTGQQGADHTRATQGEVMRHGQRGEVNGTRIQLADFAAGTHVIEVFGVPPRDQLWRAGGASRQLETRHGVGATGVPFQRGAVVKRTQRGEFLCIAVDHHVAQLRVGSGQSARHRAAIKALQLRAADVGRGLGKRTKAADFMLTVSGQGEDRPGAQAEQRKAHFDKRSAVGQVHHHIVALRDP